MLDEFEIINNDGTSKGYLKQYDELEKGLNNDITINLEKYTTDPYQKDLIELENIVNSIKYTTEKCTDDYCNNKYIYSYICVILLILLLSSLIN